MAPIDLHTLLELVGALNDNADKGSASERFRNYLRSYIVQPIDARAYIESALTHSGEQYNKALQDLINHLGHLLGFEVTFGRYRGVRNQVGFDGLWQSPTGWAVVVEAKTTDVYTVRTDTLLGYINSLVSERRISSREKVIGLYVYGRFDRQTNQLENAIAVENLRDQLRVVSVPALLNLLELKADYGISHESILGLLQPAPIRIDPTIDLISRVVAKEQERDVFLATVGEPDVILQQTLVPAPTEPSSHLEKKIAKRSYDYTNKSVVAVVFEGKRYPATTWRNAFEALLEVLQQAGNERFEAVALTLIGRKRPYFSEDPQALRKAAPVKGTNKLYFETNLSANHMARVAYDLVGQLGYGEDVLSFKVSEETS